MKICASCEVELSHRSKCKCQEQNSNILKLSKRSFHSATGWFLESNKPNQCVTGSAKGKNVLLIFEPGTGKCNLCVLVFQVCFRYFHKSISSGETLSGFMM